MTRNKPTVFLLPGLMATHLCNGEQRIWLSDEALATGGFTELALHDDAVAVDEPFDEPYQDLIEALQKRFAVVPIAIDWRQSVAVEGRRLAKSIRAALKEAKEPVHLLAHSSGGMVARALIAHNPSVWRDFSAEGGRLLMLGTPTHGTHAAVELLYGQHKIIEMVASLDEKLSLEDVVNQFRTYPGIVELLPEDDLIWDVAWWRERCSISMSQKQADQFSETLTAAKRERHKLSRVASNASMLYIAGAAPETPGAISIDDDRGMELESRDGDGVVTYESGRIDGVETWYVEAAHGDMQRLPSAFAAIIELLEQGRTTLLSQEAPSSSRRHLGLVTIERPEGISTTVEAMMAAATGGRQGYQRQRTPRTLHVEVAHGSLEHAAYPVAVGHYAGDILEGTEDYLDRRLGRRLSRRRMIDIYPKEVGDVEVVLLSPEHKPSGALVIGLGELGQITPEKVTVGITRAVLRMALELLEREDWPTRAGGWKSAAFSTVLMGTRGGRTINIETTIAAIVKGALLANRTLIASNLWNEVRVDDVQIVEIYEDLAVRAARVVAHLKDFLRLSLQDDEELDEAHRLRRLEGGYSGQPSYDYDRGWWRGLQITKKKPETGDPNAGELQFLLMTDRARAEQSLQATQRKLVDKLIRETINDTRGATDFPATLYELLIPPLLKEVAQESTNLLLVLDDETAQYPWEMLAIRRSQNSVSPLAIGMGMIRQLKTDRFRAVVQAPSSRNALVIGDPRLSGGNHLQLDGARREAETVIETLRHYDYEVTTSIGDDALTIMNKLFCREYEIIHIAAHGYFNEKNPSRSGVVLGDDIFLTAAEIQQLNVIPQLVFLNCCHLGVMGRPGHIGSAPSDAWNRLAAGVSRGLIDLGVRAVVAAGWAVHDGAARVFAEEFYRQMVKPPGQEFATALRVARRRVFDDYSDRTNTWGAYQCYGAPGFTLTTRATREQELTDDHVADHEIVRELENLRTRAGTARKETVKSYCERVQALEAVARQYWCSGAMLYQLGSTYAELKDFDAAIRCYREALEREKAEDEVPLRMIHQLANLEARYAEAIVRERRAGTPQTSSIYDPEDLFQQAFDHLNRLINLAPTAERYALLGSAYKRKAMVVATDEARMELSLAAKDAYASAVEEDRRLEQSDSEAAGAPESFNTYYAYNQAAYGVLGTPKDEPVDAILIQRLQQCISEAERKEKEQPGFWNRASRADAILMLALAEKKLEARKQDAIEAYQQAFSLDVTPRQRESVMDQFNLVVTMLGDARKQEAAIILDIKESIPED